MCTSMEKYVSSGTAIPLPHVSLSNPFAGWNDVLRTTAQTLFVKQLISVRVAQQPCLRASTAAWGERLTSIFPKIAHFFKIKSWSGSNTNMCRGLFDFCPKDAVWCVRSEVAVVLAQPDRASQAVKPRLCIANFLILVFFFWHVNGTKIDRYLIWYFSRC